MVYSSGLEVCVTWYSRSRVDGTWEGQRCWQQSHLNSAYRQPAVTLLSALREEITVWSVCKYVSISSTTQFRCVPIFWTFANSIPRSKEKDVCRLLVALSILGHHFENRSDHAQPCDNCQNVATFKDYKKFKSYFMLMWHHANVTSCSFSNDQRTEI